MKTSKPLKIALVHDYLCEYGGAERVVEALHEMFPEAPVYTAFVDWAAMGRHADRFKGWDIRESWLTQIPFYKQLYSPLRIWAPNYFESFDLSEYDVVISSSNAYMAKAVKVRPDAVHICYCHTPPRALYGYTTLSNWKQNPVTRIVGGLMNHYLRIVDFKIAQRVTHFIANSEETKRRIQKFYRRDSTVIYPPVTIAQEPTKKSSQDGYYIYVNRLALAKHPELAVQACTQLKVPLKVVGTGKMLDELKAMAGSTVEFLGAVSDEELHRLYAGAEALLYPVEDEDFGIVPVEAMGHGLPVIAHQSGGPTETIIEEKTGLFIHELTVPALIEAMHSLKRYDFNRSLIHKHSLQYSLPTFQKKMQALITKVTTS
jgi:glycosyltransferase involved in cell wall biosynthesis